MWSAWWAGKLATELVDVVDLRARPQVLDQGGWWAVVADFDGPATGYRFACVRPAPLPPAPAFVGPRPDAWVSSLTRSAYVARVRWIRQLIHEGEVYQANMCRVLSAPLRPGPHAADNPYGLAALLHRGNPAPFAGVLDVPDRWVVSASPELFLSRAGQVVRSSPIKGTGRVPEDLQDKDIAENIMITDLVRNDLQRVCEPGSVHVPTLLDVEHHPGLVHLVTTVEGRLRDAVTWGEILHALAPAGSVSGAPKHTALQAIRRAEGNQRGPYCGAIGWVDADTQQATLAVGIRTFWVDRRPQGEVAHLRFGTGAGITWGSDPGTEWEETELKAATLIGLASTGSATCTD